MDDPAAALEQFRQKWKEEVARKADPKKPESSSSASRASGKARRASDARPERPIHQPPTRHPTADIRDDSDDHHSSDAEKTGGPSSGMIQRIDGLSIQHVDDDEFSAPVSSKEPKSALEHFERAVERESQGNLGDSLSHYRKAYRLDARVDQTYRNKHFPSKPKPANPNPSNASDTVPNPAHHSSEASAAPVQLTTDELIQSFAHSTIEGAPPIIPGDIPPPCTIAKLPAEVLSELLRWIAIRDPAHLVRLALVCKKLAYHVMADNSIWKRVTLGREFGLASQRYDFVTDLNGRELVFSDLKGEQHLSNPTLTATPSMSFRNVFQTIPRIRYTGVYISTVNYTRPGAGSATANTWNNPIHIVTYYRYLRFFRNGTCISLLTTNEPIDVIHHLTPENLAFVRTGKHGPAVPAPSTSTTTAAAGDAKAPPPSAQNVMKHALRGRWRLCHAADLTNPQTQPAPAEPQQQQQGQSAAYPQPASVSSPTPAVPSSASASLPPSAFPTDLHIETEGAGPRYMYTLHLSLKSTTPRNRTATKNNKLVWKGFWSYNLLSGDWAEFQLRNDKPFYFSRVRGYGLGY